METTYHHNNVQMWFSCTYVQYKYKWYNLVKTTIIDTIFILHIHAHVHLHATHTHLHVHTHHMCSWTHSDMYVAKNSR